MTYDDTFTIYNPASFLGSNEAWEWG